MHVRLTGKRNPSLRVAFSTRKLQSGSAKRLPVCLSPVMPGISDGNLKDACLPPISLTALLRPPRVPPDRLAVVSIKMKYFWIYLSNAE